MAPSVAGVRFRLHPRHLPRFAKRLVREERF